MTSIRFMTKVYNDESFGQDVFRDIEDIIGGVDYVDLPDSEYGFKRGTFKVIVEWEDE